MVDLNLWRLEYRDTVLEFGTRDSGHPFVEQVKIGPADLEPYDSAHPASDGIVFGRDLTRGRILEFVGAHLTTAAQPVDRRWVPAMDGSAVFEGAWRARWVREKAGRVATLANVDRGRLVYGRPRPFGNDHGKVRQGWLTYAAAFATVDDRFYSTTEKVATAGVDAGSVSAMTFPVTFPYTGAVPSESRTWVDNAGTDDTWPVVTFRRGGKPRLEFLNDAGGIDWTLEVDKNLADDESVVIDTRPWARTVELNGTAAPGLLRGSRMDKCRIGPGSHELRLVAVDTSGLAEVEVRWRDAFGAL